MFNSPSLANCDLTRLDEQLNEMSAGGVDFFHIDLIDGHYVNNLGFPPRIISDIKKRYPQIITDVHLMVTEPISYVSTMQECGADFVCFHTDSTRFVIRTLKAYHDAGMKAGIVLNPSQCIESILPYLSYVDMVVMMAVEPGFAGQSYLPETTQRVRELCKLRNKLNLDFLISVDGGVNHTIGRQLKKIGVDVIVGTIHNIFQQPDGLEAACKSFKSTLG